MKALRAVGIVVTGLAIIVCLVLTYASIWVPGETGDRLAFTAYVTLLVAAGTGLGTVAIWTVES